MDLPTLSRQPFPGVQRGAASVGIAMLIMFILAAAVVASMMMSGSSVRDAATNEEQISALFLAESGLERAMGILSSATSSGTMNGSVCTGINDGVTYYELGRGNFKYVSAIPTCIGTGCVAATCTGATCDSCTVGVTGKVNAASRTLNLGIGLITLNGTSGFGGSSTHVPPNVTMALKNVFNVPATAVFNLAWRRQGGTTGEVVAGGNASASICTDADCGLQWNVESSSGSPSGGSMGVSVGIPALDSFPVSQTISTDRNYAEVGALFPGLIVGGVPVGPTIIGSYWNDTGGAVGTRTVNNASGGQGTLGRTNGGVATTGTCPSATNSTNTSQSCTSWCTGGDTLVFGVSARSTTFADEITTVTFNTNGSPSQSVPLTQIAHFPKTSGLPASTGDIYSEIWYAYNPDYLYGAQATGSIAANVPGGLTTFTANTILNNGTLNVTGITAGALSVGETITGAGIPPIPATKISSFGTGRGGIGTYNLSNTATATATAVSMTATSTVLTVANVASGALSVGNTLYSTGNPSPNVIPGTTIFAVGPVVGGNPTYYLSVPNTSQTVSSRTITAGATSSGTTVSVPNGSLPAEGTIVAVRSGNGSFNSRATVVQPIDLINKTFTVSTASAGVTPEITLTLSGAQICGGTCAFFDNPSSTSSTTQFTITRTAGTNQWGGGFICLSGVDKDKINPVTRSLTSAGTWREVVQ